MKQHRSNVKSVERAWERKIERCLKLTIKIHFNIISEKDSPFDGIPFVVEDMENSWDLERNDQNQLNRLELGICNITNFQTHEICALIIYVYKRTILLFPTNCGRIFH